MQLYEKFGRENEWIVSNNLFQISKDSQIKGEL